MERLNGTNYRFGKVKGMFDVRETTHAHGVLTTHVMIELIEVK